MSDGPMRWSDPRSKSAAQMRLLLRAARTDVPAEARVRDLGARLGLGAGAIGSAAKGAVAASVTASASVVSLGVAKLCVVALLGVAVVAAAVVARESGGAPGDETATAHALPWPAARAAPSPQRPPRVTAAPPALPAPVEVASSPDAPPARGVRAASAPIAMPVAPHVFDTPLGAAASTTAGDDSSSSAPGVTEGALLLEAQRALRSDPSRALALTERATRLFPRGTLAQEREVIAVEALVRLGRTSEARARAAAFARAFPTSAHRARVEALAGAARATGAAPAEAPAQRR